MFSKQVKKHWEEGRGGGRRELARSWGGTGGYRGGGHRWRVGTRGSWGDREIQRYRKGVALWEDFVLAEVPLWSRCG